MLIDLQFLFLFSSQAWRKPDEYRRGVVRQSDRGVSTLSNVKVGETRREELMYRLLPFLWAYWKHLTRGQYPTGVKVHALGWYRGVMVPTSVPI